MSPTILHQDDRILVIDKPSGLLSVPGLGEANQDNLASRMAALAPGARNVHRLDRDTSGVIVMARDAAAHRELGRQFEQREVQKTYVAIVDGRMADESGTIDLPMRKDMDPALRGKPRHLIDHVRGKQAVTAWRVLETGADPSNWSRLLLQPRTGRSHQLRVHLAAIGHAILGDDLYAPPEAFARAPRLMLHAQSLTLTHPGAGQRMTFTAACPF
jgi:tRNA pseudouridine32 synthase / 23S rRNA pseudouridine746 synthase